MLALLEIILNVISPIFVVMGIAFFLSKRNNPDPSSLSVFLIYLFVPALVFKGIYETKLTGGELGAIAIVVVGVATTLTVVSFLVARFLNYDEREKSSLVLSVILVNAANYGIPLNTFAFGAEGGNVAIFYYVVSATVGNILGVYFASRGKFSAKDAIINVLKVPISYAAILGLVLNLMNVELPLIIRRSVLEIAAPASIPVMLALLGLQLARVSFKPRAADDTSEKTLANNWVAVFTASGIKLLVAPVVALILALLLGLEGTTFKVAIVESSMPTAVLASALATQFGGDARFVSAVTMVATLASIVTLSLLILALGGVTA